MNARPSLATLATFFSPAAALIVVHFVYVILKQFLAGENLQPLSQITCLLDIASPICLGGESCGMTLRPIGLIGLRPDRAKRQVSHVYGGECRQV